MAKYYYSLIILLMKRKESLCALKTITKYLKMSKKLARRLSFDWQDLVYIEGFEIFEKLKKWNPDISSFDAWFYSHLEFRMLDRLQRKRHSTARSEARRWDVSRRNDKFRGGRRNGLSVYQIPMRSVNDNTRMKF